ncbi:hypothetical protein AX17_002616 [Amanita inopinata Kibby_2008]|nr:hypothetical protein AX17_002616 [Amanita inopinata Kibby_2008]
MRTIGLLRNCSPCALLLLCIFPFQTLAYFWVSEPNRDTLWQNGGVQLLAWQKGKLDGINSFDIEMARLSDTGLTFVAKGVSSKQKSLNIMLQDVPPGDDYFVLFLNSTHGVTHGISSRFTVLSSSDSSKSNSPPPDSSAPTVTVSGTPDPTRGFATTFPAAANGDVCGWGRPWRIQLGAVSATLAVFLLSTIWTLL